MKTYLALAVFVLAIYIGLYEARDCPHGDVSLCVNIDCQNDGDAVVCLHNICTCDVAPMNCTMRADCSTMQCDKRDESSHCVDQICVCQRP